MQSAKVVRADVFLEAPAGIARGVVHAARTSTSVLATAIRGGSGASVGTVGARPDLPLILYEMEPCPASRKVREALSRLDLEAEIRPCPRGSIRHRSELRGLRGQEVIPYLIDVNTERQLGDADAIVTYLYRSYGNGCVPRSLRPGVLGDASSKIASALRMKAGERAVPATRPEHLLELFTYEASATGRRVREWLSAHEIAYLLRPAAKGSSARDVLMARNGRADEPVLRDPNNNRELAGDVAILDYLEARYGLERVPRGVRLRFLPGGRMA